MGRVYSWLAKGAAGCVLACLCPQALAISVTDLDSDDVAMADQFQQAVSMNGHSAKRSCAGQEPGGAENASPISSIPWNLSLFQEKRSVGPESQPRLYALQDQFGAIHPEREPLILVHGLYGSPSELQAVADHFKTNTRFQLYVLAYREAQRPIADNAEEFAQELRWLKTVSTGARDHGATILAHSMGGIVSRQLLNALAFDADSKRKPFGPVHLVAVDTPWHGFPGPGDDAFGGLIAGVSKPFVPAAIMDMRASSRLFQGDPSNEDPARRKGLSNPEVDARIDLVFAEEGDEALDYTKGVLAEQLPGAIVRHFNDDDFFAGDPRVRNFWLALVSSSKYMSFEHEMEDLADAGTLTEARVIEGLKRYYPRYPGNHVTVLLPHPGQHALLDDLDELTK